jgi:hypothetical protein
VQHFSAACLAPDVRVCQLLSVPQAVHGRPVAFCLSSGEGLIQALLGGAVQSRKAGPSGDLDLHKLVYEPATSPEEMASLAPNGALGRNARDKRLDFSFRGPLQTFGVGYCKV